ncbi:MAG: DUF87 domain-containing protein [Christensenellaceae bacterium]|jgi:DNA replication protein DnaC|nr:DUF87 domain-containing protein [Christensenellaceae bacterium]
MRVIPKNTKVRATIIKGLTMSDFVVAGFCLLFLGIIAFSSIPSKIFIVIALAIPLGLLFAPITGEGRFYTHVGAVLQFLFAQKDYSGVEIKKLIPYTKILDDGTIVYPEYFSKVISVGQIEFSLLSEHAQNTKISVLERLLKLVDDDGCLDLVKIDRPLNLDSFSASLFKKVCTQIAPVKSSVLKSRIEQIDRLNNLDKQYRPFYYVVFYGSSKNRLAETAELAVSVLHQCELGGSITNERETVNFLKYCNTRFFDEREILDIDPDKFIDYISPKKIKFTSSSYIIDDVEAFSVAISDYPLTVGNAWGADMFNINNTKVVLKIRPLDRVKAIRRIDKAVNEIGSRESDIAKASEVVANESHLETMASTLQAIQNENESLFDCSLTITAFNNNKEPSAVVRRAIRHKIISCGFKIAQLRSLQMQGFLTSNISATRVLKRYERGINSSSLAAVFPFVSTSIIDMPDGIVLGYNQYPVALDISKRDGNHTNSNCLILGKPGSGKSYAAKTIISNLFADDWRVFILDVENEFSTLCNNVGGSKIDVGAATQGRINPFHIYGLLTDDGKTATSESVFTNHLIALESFFKITLDGISPDTLELVNNLVIESYTKKGITETSDFTNISACQFPIFDDLLKVVQTKLKTLKNTSNAHMLQNLQRAETYISKFATGGRYSSLWNGYSTLSADKEFTVFNFQSLLANKNQIVANAQMLLVMRFLEQEIINTRDKNRDLQKLVRTVIVADEAHAFTDPKFPIALDFLFQMAKRIRKYAGSLFFITQNLGDGTANQEVSSKTQAIFANCQYSFIFNLPPQDIHRLVSLYEKSGGINEAEQNEITSNPQGSCFLISATRERASFSIVATPVVEKLFIRNDEKQL